MYKFKKSPQTKSDYGVFIRGKCTVVDCGIYLYVVSILSSGINNAVYLSLFLSL